MGECAAEREPYGGSEMRGNHLASADGYIGVVERDGIGLLGGYGDEVVVVAVAVRQGQHLWVVVGYDTCGGLCAEVANAYVGAMCEAWCCAAGENIYEDVVGIGVRDEEVAACDVAAVACDGVAVATVDGAECGGLCGRVVLALVAERIDGWRGGAEGIYAVLYGYELHGIIGIVGDTDKSALDIGQGQGALLAGGGVVDSARDGALAVGATAYEVVVDIGTAACGARDGYAVPAAGESADGRGCSAVAPQIGYSSAVGNEELNATVVAAARGRTNHVRHSDTACDIGVVIDGAACRIYDCHGGIGGEVLWVLCGLSVRPEVSVRRLSAHYREVYGCAQALCVASGAGDDAAYLHGVGGCCADVDAIAGRAAIGQGNGDAVGSAARDVLYEAIGFAVAPQISGIIDEGNRISLYGSRRIGAGSRIYKSYTKAAIGCDKRLMCAEASAGIGNGYAYACCDLLYVLRRCAIRPEVAIGCLSA